MKELIEYCLPGGCVQRDTRELKRANKNITMKRKSKDPIGEAYHKVFGKHLPSEKSKTVGAVLSRKKIMASLKELFEAANKVYSIK